jgi:hypothetical protein
MFLSRMNGERNTHADYTWLRGQRELIMRIPTTN